MKYILIALAFLLPFTASATQLTVDQAKSLIGVVQSSTSTPASAFTGLITAFSNITQPQAESLIAVVQGSPQSPADAFVNLLLAFTVDQVASTTPVVTPAPTPAPTPVMTPVRAPASPVVQIVAPTLTITPTPTYGDQTFSAGMEKVLLGEATFTAGESEDVTINGIAIALPSAYPKYITNLYLTYPNRAPVACNEGCSIGDGYYPVNIVVPGGGSVIVYIWGNTMPTDHGYGAGGIQALTITGETNANGNSTGLHVNITPTQLQRMSIN
jgi:hypothetical protein